MRRNKSTISAHFGDEALRIRDIQFDDPQIGITCPAPLEPCSHHPFFSYEFRTNDRPFIPFPTSEKPFSERRTNPLIITYQ